LFILTITFGHAQYNLVKCKLWHFNIITAGSAAEAE